MIFFVPIFSFPGVNQDQILSDAMPSEKLVVGSESMGLENTGHLE